MNGSIIINENGFQLVRYDDELFDPDEYYLTLWHMHPERKKKQGLISDGRKCMDCGAIAPEVIGGFPVDELGCVDSEWDKINYAKIEADRLAREGWSDEKKAEDLKARLLMRQAVKSMNMDEWEEWKRVRKARGDEYEVWTEADSDYVAAKEKGYE